MNKRFLYLYLFVGIIGWSGCTNQLRVIQREQKAMNAWRELNPDLSYLKAHMHNGDLYVLDQWSVDTLKHTLKGAGVQYDPNRKVVSQQNARTPFQIPWSEVALLETNDLGEDANAEVKALAIMTGISVSITGFCAANPKVCFGSCPTIYGQTERGYEIMAESFSASISPALEEADVDMLTRLKVAPIDETTTLYLTNEALETHMIRQMQLWALPKSETERVFATPDGSFRQILASYDPTSAQVDHRDILPLIHQLDGAEYFSLADPKNLDTDETLFLEFDLPTSGSYGFAIDKRQSLMTTFLLYQGLAYMGPMASWFLSQVERNQARMGEVAVPMMDRLNGIQIDIFLQGTWQAVDWIHETGPIASDLHVIQLPKLPQGKVQIRLNMNKAMWRIDYCSLVQMGKEVHPQSLPLISVADSARQPNTAWKEQLLDSTQFMINLPGASQYLTYQLPEQPDTYEYFLNCQGYYLEWMRDEWMAEYSPRMVFQYFRRPKAYLKQIAPIYKAQEAEMEGIFWNSRFEN